MWILNLWQSSIGLHFWSTQFRNWFCMFLVTVRLLLWGNMFCWTGYKFCMGANVLNEFVNNVFFFTTVPLLSWSIIQQIVVLEKLSKSPIFSSECQWKWINLCKDRAYICVPLWGWGAQGVGEKTTQLFALHIGRNSSVQDTEESGRTLSFSYKFVVV